MSTVPLSRNELLLLLIVASASLLAYFERRKRSLLPPGPRGLPIIGNLFDIPATKTWEAFWKWSDQYGPLISVTVLGQPIIVLHKVEYATQLYERKAAITSERPRLVMGGEMVGYGQTTPLLPYGPTLKTSRSQFSRLIGSVDSLSKFSAIQEEESHRFLKRLLTYPEDVDRAVRQTAGSLIFRITYGIKVQDPVDPYVSIFDEATTQFAELVSPGAFLVDVIPILKYLPSWTGLSFLRKAREYKESFNKMVQQPFDFTRKQLQDGDAPPSFTAGALTELEMTDKMKDELKYTATAVCAGASDTTVGVVLGFFLAMAMFPEVQKKAQEEIDSIVGDGRLPTIADCDSLPYTKALAKEALRWHPVAPNGLPRATKEDTMLDGYLIPAGSFVFTNLLRISYDPILYPNPEVFDPTRHMDLPGNPAQKDPFSYGFGCGRRVCPGKLLAEQSIFLEAAATLATFNITPKVKDGKPVKLHHGWRVGALSAPEHFDIDVKPRSESARALILEDIES